MIAYYLNRFSIEVIYQGQNATRSVLYRYRVGPRTARRIFIRNIGDRYYYRMVAAEGWEDHIVQDIAVWVAKDFANRKVVKAALEHFLYRFYQINKYLDSIEQSTLAFSPLQMSYIRPSVNLHPSYLKKIVNELRSAGKSIISFHSLRIRDRERLGGHRIRGHDGRERIVYAGMFAHDLYLSKM